LGIAVVKPQIWYLSRQILKNLSGGMDPEEKYRRTFGSGGKIEKQDLV